MFTWAFAYMHVQGPHPVIWIVFVATIVIDFALIAMLSGAFIRGRWEA